MAGQDFLSQAMCCKEAKPREKKESDARRAVSADLSQHELRVVMGKQDGSGEGSRRWPEEVDSDGEEVQLCYQCGLPVGETAYRPEEKAGALKDDAVGRRIIAWCTRSAWLRSCFRRGRGCRWMRTVAFRGSKSI